MQADVSDEEDEDYKPPSVGESSESEAERATKKARIATPLATVDDKVNAEQSRQALWEDFQTSVGGSSRADTKDIRMIEIEKRYKFAGREITEKKMVPADSDEAKEWTASKTLGDVASGPIATDKTALPESSIPSQAVTVSLLNRPKPGPRRPRVNLTSSKPKKLTMLEKSAMDWSAHLAETDKSTKEELEANRRSGGSLAKHDFLERVGVRRQDEVEKDLGKKRRR
ncbi:hypothetical protein CALCODRAFT_479755 [Calocera cornea HHB12733]|uniref:SWR1-complex protein 5 n=1 Tax=Calocera cornea HHB12733 TaxID=1353952 RepID=A0A165JEA8_9BASI|nr:hypothetical protein CALCODRAFT_479755 [Calocera cornea HHB12733]